MGHSDISMKLTQPDFNGQKVQTLTEKVLFFPAKKESFAEIFSEIGGVSGDANFPTVVSEH